MDLYWIILAPLLCALVAPRIVGRLGPELGGLLLSLVPFGIAGWLVADVLRQAATAEWSMTWIASMNVDLALRVGGFERLFLFLVSFIGGLICIYGGAYLHGDSKAPRFFATVMLFMGSMLGVIAADDLILTFVFWELTSLTSFLLIGYKHSDAGARKAALMSLLVTGGGGLALLAGLILLTAITGESRISALAAHSAEIGASPLFVPALLLVLLGAFTKSAQVPFHFWLPGAMAAPTPVSAYLHSATMVKAGVILLAKLSPALSQSALWGWIVTPVGAATMLTGVVMAVYQTDLKRLLAYSTVSVLGTLVMLLGFGDAFSFKTAMFLALVHGFYKGGLFMVAGTVDHAAGTRDVRLLSGLRSRMPWLAAAAMLAALSMSGLPPTLGFISKELLYETKLAQPVAHHALAAIGVLANALAVAIALIVGVRPFLGAPGKAKIHHSPGPGLFGPPLVLALLGLVLGFAPGALDKFLISPAAAAQGFIAPEAKLTLWHGWTPVLALSALTVLLGLAVFAGRGKLGPLAAAFDRLRPVSPTSLYQSGLDGLLRLAAVLTGWIQNGQLRIYVRVTLGAATFLILLALVKADTGLQFTSRVSVGVYETTLLLLMIVSSVAAVRARSRLAAILCLGGVGYSVAFLFADYGAPDLAITQLLVETLTVVLFSFVILKLPQIRLLSRKPSRRWDALFATLAGVIMTLVVWESVHESIADPISPGLVERSATEAYGRNVVNVILVDFRALDTLGEILVLALACLGVTALLFRKRKVQEADRLPSERAVADSGKLTVEKEASPS